MYVVATGNAFEGIILHGPFTEHEEACVWAETERLPDWLVVEVQSPEEF